MSAEEDASYLAGYDAGYRAALRDLRRYPALTTAYLVAAAAMVEAERYPHAPISQIFPSDP